MDKVEEKGKVFFERLRYPMGSCEYKSERSCNNAATWKICLDDLDNEMLWVCTHHAFILGLKDWLEEN